MLACVAGVWKGRESGFWALKLPFPSLSYACHAGQGTFLRIHPCHRTQNGEKIQKLKGRSRSEEIAWVVAGWNLKTIFNARGQRQLMQQSILNRFIARRRLIVKVCAFALLLLSFQESNDVVRSCRRHPSRSSKGVEYNDTNVFSSTVSEILIPVYSGALSLCWGTSQTNQQQ